MNSELTELSIRGWMGRLLVTAFVWSACPLYSQVDQLKRFVSPQYPPLARQVTISGQVALKAKVGQNGDVVNVEVVRSAHPMLTQSAIAAVKEWEFEPGRGERPERIASVLVIYGLSGIVRASNPKTTIAADFEHLSVRVFVTTDAYPTGHYDPVDPPMQPAQTQKE